MAKFTAEQIRNVCFVGHGDSGKTTLADSLLFHAKAVSRRGNVKDKSSVFDFEDLAREKGHTLDTSMATLEWDGCSVNIIDTPGYPDFVGEAIGGLAATESAVICVSAVGGVQVNTRRVYQLAKQMDRARAIVVTKCDLPDWSFDSIMTQIVDWFGAECVPVTLPNAFGTEFSSTERILRSKGGATPEGKDYYKAFIESAVEVDDEATMLYLDGKEVPDELLKHCIVEAVRRGKIVPVLFTSSEKDVGMEDVLFLLSGLLPGAERRGGRKVYDNPEGKGEGTLIETGADLPLLAHVFKLTIDKHVGKVAYVRVLAGHMATGQTVHISSTGKKDKITHPVKPFGKEMRPVDGADVGEIVALPKMDSLEIGTTISGDEGVYLGPIPFPKPMANLAVRPKSRNDETKISEALQKLAAESPTFDYHRDPVTHEAIASGMSNLQLDTIFRRLKDRYHIEIETAPARIAYRETITTKAEGHYRHKKQSGGRGQFGEVFLRVEPCEPGSGLVFNWDVVGGSIPSNFAPAIEKGVREKMTHGVIAGYPMLDVIVSVHDGKYHDVDSSEAAFKIAGGRAFAEAVQKARPSILEPMVDVEITVPSQFMGDISGDLNTRRGRIQGMDQIGTFQVIKAHVPLSSMQEYPRVITSITSGEGSFTYHDAGYEQVPGNVQAEIVASFKPREEED